MTIKFIHEGMKVDLPTGTTFTYKGGLYKVIPRLDPSYLSHHPCTYCQADDHLCNMILCNAKRRHDDVSIIIRWIAEEGGEQ